MEDLVALLDQVRRVYKTLSGRAVLRSLDPWLTVDIQGDGHGYLAVKCELQDNPGIGNRLKVALQLDQTRLPKLLLELDAIADAFPRIARP